MKKQMMQEVTVCENCGKAQDYAMHCDGCKKDYCLDCARKFLKQYKNGVHFSGSDLNVCSACDLKPPKSLIAPLKAYRLIEALRSEETDFYKRFRPRMEAAEEETKRHYATLRGWK